MQICREIIQWKTIAHTVRKSVLPFGMLTKSTSVLIGLLKDFLSWERRKGFRSYMSNLTRSFWSQSFGQHFACASVPWSSAEALFRRKPVFGYFPFHCPKTWKPGKRVRHRPRPKMKWQKRLIHWLLYLFGPEGPSLFCYCWWSFGGE